MTLPASELIARLEVSQRACFDAGLHVAAMDIQSARAEIARTAANQSGSERAGVGARGPVEVKQVHKLRHLLNHMPDKDFHLPREEAQELLRYIEALATLPAQPAAAATHGKPDGAAREALRNLLDYAEQRECSHEATHRGGSIWTICDECGKKWADDRGGFIPYQEPKEITQARAALHSPKIAAAETSPGDAYREVIDEALIVRHLGVAKGDAKAELNQILDWDVAAALDPAVSGRKA